MYSCKYRIASKAINTVAYRHELLPPTTSSLPTAPLARAALLRLPKPAAWTAHNQEEVVPSALSLARLDTRGEEVVRLSLAM